MNKRFKRFQKLLVVSLATSYCSVECSNAWSLGSAMSWLKQKICGISSQKIESQEEYQYSKEISNADRLKKQENIKEILISTVESVGLGKEKEEQLAIMELLTDYRHTLGANEETTFQHRFDNYKKKLDTTKKREDEVDIKQRLEILWREFYYGANGKNVCQELFDAKKKYDQKINAPREKTYTNTPTGNEKVEKVIENPWKKEKQQNKI